MSRPVGVETVLEAAGGLALLSLLALIASNCGGGDEESTPPPAAPTAPAAPAPTPPPPPEAPAKVTGIKAAEVGQDFILWTWDRAEGATSYEADVAPGQPHVYPKEPSYRYEGLDPGTAHKIWVRSVRETAGGRATSEWSDGVEAFTLGPPSVLQARVMVISVPSPFSGQYTVGQWIRFLTEFEEPVRVEGSPALEIDIGGEIRRATFSPWIGGRTSHPDHPRQSRVKRGFELIPRFDYLVVEEDRDENGFSISTDAFDFSEGRLLSEAGGEVQVEIRSVIPDEAGGPPVDPGRDLAAHPVRGTSLTRRCTVERSHARAFGSPTALVEEWDGTPFTFYFSLVGLPDAKRSDAQRVLEAAAQLAERIEEQIGYSIFGVGGWERDSQAVWPDSGGCDWRASGQIVATYVGSGPARAHPRCAMWQGGLEFGNGTVSHELFHLFGFTHHPNGWRGPGTYGHGVFMSNRLNGVYVDEEDIGVTFEDVDALRCVFPEGG